MTRNWVQAVKIPTACRACAAIVLSAWLATCALNVLPAAAAPLVRVAVSADATSAANPDLSPTHRWVGLYVPGAPLQISPLAASETRVGMPPAHFTNYFQNTAQNFTDLQAGNATAHGSIPLVTLELFDPTKGVNQPAYSLRSIANGNLDAYLHHYAQGAKAFGHPVWLRLFHEMNGNWYPWCGTVNGNTPGDFLAAWKHVKSVFTAEGATNVKFVWCPNIESIDAAGSLSNPANSIDKYWPGDDYVDYIALDGYNFGTAGGLKWRSFTSLFSAPYGAVTALSSSRPIFVAETGCATVGGDKAAWIADMFKVIPGSFPRLAGIGWFDCLQKYDWRINSSSGSLQAFAAGGSSSAWMGRRASAITIKSNVTYGRLGRAFTLSGVLSPPRVNDPVRVEVKKPGSSVWAYSCTRYTSGASGAWSLGYTPKARGSYYFRVRFRGDSPRFPSLSRVIRVTVK